MKDNNKVISGMRKSANPNLNKIALELKKSQSDIDWHKIALSVNKNVVDDNEKIDFFFYHQTKGILILYENCFSIGFRNEVSTLNKIVNTYVKIFEKKFSDSFSEIFEANINNLYFKLSYLRAALSTIITMHSPSVSDLIKNAEEIIYKVEDYYGLVRFSRDIGRTVINNEIHPDFVSLKNHINEQLEFLKNNIKFSELEPYQDSSVKENILFPKLKAFLSNYDYFVKSDNSSLDKILSVPFSDQLKSIDDLIDELKKLLLSKETKEAKAAIFKNHIVDLMEIWSLFKFHEDLINSEIPKPKNEFEKYVLLCHELNLIVFNEFQMLCHTNGISFFELCKDLKIEPEFIDSSISIHFEEDQPQQDDSHTPKLSLKEVAIKCHYEGVFNENLDKWNEIARKYGHTSGKKLQQHFNFYSNNTDRRAYAGSTLKHRHKIERFENVMEVLEVDKTNIQKDIELLISRLDEF